MAEDFTLAGYGALLDAFAERGYAARSFEDADPAARHLVLRHDLDMSLDAAVPVAEAESGLPLGWLHALHKPREPGRSPSCRVLGRAGQDRMRHPPPDLGQAGLRAPHLGARGAGRYARL